jgi:hypothetical protein
MITAFIKYENVLLCAGIVELTFKHQYFDLYKVKNKMAWGNPYKYEKNGKEKSFKLKKIK